MHGIDVDTRLDEVLLIGAHSDDIEIGAGGTIQWLVERFPRMRVHWVVLSADGTRRAEAFASAASVLDRAHEPHVEVLDFRDGFFPYTGPQLKEAFELIKKRSNPDLVLTHDREDLHQDHRLVGELTWNTFRDHFILEYEVLKYDGGLRSPNFFVPLPDRFVEKKVAGLMRFFGSQRNKQWFSEESFRGLMRVRGVECRAESGYAEAFHCRKVVWNPACTGER